MKYKLPSRYVVLTLDDGLITAMRAADWIAERGFKATFFVTRDRSLGKPGFMRERDIRQLRIDGFSLGTHGTTHRKLTHISHKECQEELVESRAWLEGVLGEPIHFTAVPGGFINSQVFRLATEAGYTLVGTCNEWMNTATDMHTPTAINRVNIRRHFSMSEFRDVVEGRLTFYARRQLRSAALWVPKQLMPA
jgi:peptidoglycan/xylan/chitin deacetylase (PgdA/CDA1 family)